MATPKQYKTKVKSYTPPMKSAGGQKVKPPTRPAGSIPTPKRPAASRAGGGYGSMGAAPKKPSRMQATREAFKAADVKNAATAHATRRSAVRRGSGPIAGGAMARQTQARSKPKPNPFKK